MALNMVARSLKKTSGSAATTAPVSSTSPVPKRIRGARARSAEDKEAVRQTLIAAGRKAFADGDYTKVSLRGIATAAGYTPASVYQYFADRQALFLAVRESDLANAVDLMETVATGDGTPEERLRELIATMHAHWRKHFDQYQILFSTPPQSSPTRYSDGTLFGQSPVAKRAYGMYEEAVKAFLDTLPCHPVPLKLATDALVVAIHGAVAAPMHMQGMAWTAGAPLARAVVDAFLIAWTTEAKQKASAKRSGKSA